MYSVFGDCSKGKGGGGGGGAKNQLYKDQISALYQAYNPLILHEKLMLYNTSMTVGCNFNFVTKTLAVLSILVPITLPKNCAILKIENVTRNHRIIHETLHEVSTERSLNFFAKFQNSLP
jgi:hypothetical protein